MKLKPRMFNGWAIVLSSGKLYREPFRTQGDAMGMFDPDADIGVVKVRVTMEPIDTPYVVRDTGVDVRMVKEKP